jgi:hypothetical protein
MEEKGMSKCGCLKLKPISLGFAIGIVSGLCMMALAWVAWKSGFGMMMVQQRAAIFPGYEASFVGGFYGLGWGILVGYVFGLLTGIFYNICICCCSKRCSCCCCNTPKTNM